MAVLIKSENSCFLQHFAFNLKLKSAKGFNEHNDCFNIDQKSHKEEITWYTEPNYDS